MLKCLHTRICQPNETMSKQNVMEYGKTVSGSEIYVWIMVSERLRSYVCLLVHGIAVKLLSFSIFDGETHEHVLYWSIGVSIHTFMRWKWYLLALGLGVNILKSCAGFKTIFFYDGSSAMWQIGQPVPCRRIYFYLNINAISSLIGLRLACRTGSNLDKNIFDSNINLMTDHLIW